MSAELFHEIKEKYEAGVTKASPFAKGDYLSIRNRSSNIPPMETTMGYKLSNDPEINLHDVTVGSMTINSIHDGYPIECTTYKSSDDYPPLVIFIHGGGFVAGNVKKSHCKILAYARALGYTIIACDYRKAPEFPYPIPYEDCFSCLKYGYENAETLKIDKSKIILVGVSAGASLAAATCMMALDRGIPVAKQALLYPMLDPRSVCPSDATEQDKAIAKYADWSFNNNYTGWGCMFGEEKYKKYVDSGFDAKELVGIESWATPALFENKAALPKTYINIGSVDVFYHEATKFHQDLLNAGVESKIDVDEGFVHGHDDLLSYPVFLNLYLKRIQGIKL